MDINKRYRERLRIYEESKVISEVMESGTRDLKAFTLNIRPAKSEIIIAGKGLTCNDPNHEAFGCPIEECPEDECILESFYNE